MSRSRRKRNINKAKIRNLIIAFIIAVFLFSIYKFNFLTKSEVAITTPVSFVELETGNPMSVDLELFQDENYYIILPETVNGFFARKYFVDNAVKPNTENKDTVENTNTQPENTNTTSENPLEIEINKPTNTVANETPKEEITNTVQNDNPLVEDNSNTVTKEEVKEENTNLPVTAKADSLFDLAKAANNGENILENDENKDIPNEDIQNPENIQGNNDGSNGESNNKEPENTVENIVNDNTVAEDTNTLPDNNQEENVPPNPQTPVENENPKPQEPNTNTVDNNVTKEPDNKENESEEVGLNIYSVGERIYLSKEDVENGTCKIQVEYETVEVNNLKLYKQELKSDLGEAEIKLTGFIPAGYYLNVTPADKNAITELKDDTEELKNSEVLLAYDIKIVNEGKEYQPVDYYQTVNVEITSAVQLAGKIDNKPVEVVHIAEDVEKDEIKFEKISLAEKETDKIEFITNEFSTYAVLAYAAIQPDSVTIYDYDSDYNYYMGKNYTDNNVGTNQNLYRDDNLAEVTINYYGYDYSKNLNETRNFNITPGWRNASNANSGGYRQYTIEITAQSTNTIINDKANWQMSFTLPQAAANSFNIARTQQQNNNLNMAYDSGTRVVTISANDWSGWTKESHTSYRRNIVLAFSGTVNINNVAPMSLTAVEKNLIGYVSADPNERQSLFTYVKCMPIVNGNVTFDLIDNPYMDRPAGFGFDGWASHENGHNPTINSENNVQTLTVNTNGSKQVTVNLYANWKEAKVIFISAGANGNGLTLNNPVNTDWNTINNALGTARQAQNASDRELNILVLINGTLTNLNALGDKAYTLTSLYDGVDYRNNNTRLNLTQNFTLKNDLQLDYLNVTGSANYTSETVTGTITRQIIADGRNFRIGRGMMPLTINNTTTTFGQVLGLTNTNPNRAYKLVIESGKYANIQTATTSSPRSVSTNANLTLGCDYDRAAGTNNNLYVYNRVATRSGSGTYNPRVSERPLFETIVKSGTIGMDFFSNQRGDYAFSGIYLGGHSSGTDKGDRIMIVEGGNIANLLGGLALQSSTATEKTCIYVKGGTIQNIVGGAGVSTTYANRTIQVTDGTVAYSVSGGSNGYTAGTASASNSTGTLDGNTLVYIGGNAIIGTEDINSELYYVNAGCVLGAGNGNNDEKETAGKVNSSHVIIDGNAYIANSVYGGGNFGIVGNEREDVGNIPQVPLVEFSDESDNISQIEKPENYLITDGTRVGTSNELTVNGNNINDIKLEDTRIPEAEEEWTVTKSGTGYTIQNVSNQRYLGIETQGNWWWNEEDVLTTLTTPYVFTYSNHKLSTTHNGTTYNLRYNNNWTITTNPNDSGTNIYFLKYKELPPPEQPEEPDPLKTTVTVDIYGGTIKNNVYGGANNNDINGSVDINMHNGTVEGTIYGGSNSEGTVLGVSDINIEGGTLGNNASLGDILFAGGKGRGTVINQYSKININDKSNNLSLFGNIYGGSELGNVRGNSYIDVHDIYSDKNSILMNGNIYGGGKGQNNTAATNGRNVTVTVDGGNYPSAKAFGGCNIRGTIGGNVLVKIGENYNTIINEVYGGGNQSQVTTDTNNVYVHLFKNAVVGNAFNGGNNAGIDGDNTNLPRSIYAKGAKVDNLYGGSNSSGTLSDTFVYCSDSATIGNVYGGGYGQNTNITGNTNVNITSINEQTGTTVNPATTITGNVFGGGDNGPVNGYTNVNVISSAVNGTVYGGGNNAEVGIDTKVIINNSNISTIFGGGNLGIVRNNTDVDIINSSKIGTLYGGGCSAAINGYTDVYVEGCPVDNVYGGGQGIDATVQNDTNVTLVPNGATKTIINQNVYGGGDQGRVNGKTLINVTETTVTGTVYGGGNRADIGNSTGVHIVDNSEVNTVYGGGNEGKVGTTTNVNVLNSTITDTVYGGGNKGVVTGNTLVRVDTSNIANSIFGGGKAANVNGTQVTVQGKSITTNVYGGGDQGEVVESTNVLIDDSTINKNVYGGGNGAATIENAGTIPGKIGLNTNVIIRNNVEIKENTFGGGQGITAIVSGNTNFDITNSTIGNDIYGGGDNGSVTGNTNVYIDSCSITGNAYAAGNGANALVRGNSYICAEGTTQIGKSIFGGGNAAETGPTGADTSLGIVDIAGAIIGENVYGGANSSVINGNTIVNIGTEAINQYYGVNKGYKQGKIDIGNTVFGGGESMDPSKDFDYDSISVTGTILININGKNYANDDINVGGSIFGSGNASSAKTNGDINIRNYGTIDDPKKGVSIQRASDVVLDNTNITLSGTTDSTSAHASTYFTLNRISSLKLKNNSTMFLRNGANLLENFYSMVGDDGNEEYAQVTVNNRIYTTDGKTYDAKGDKVFDGSGNVKFYMKNGAVYDDSNEKVGDVDKIETLGIDRNVDNRVYMYSGINLNISPSENLESYGEVKGMTFFGIYKNAAGGDGGDSDIYTGMYDKDYSLGNQINWNERDFTRCYVVGMHQKAPEQDIQVDGFYTNFEKLGVDLSGGDILTEDNYSGVSYCNYITPTPENDIYYMWYAGPDVEVYYYTFGLMASKFSTLGTKELSLLGLSFPNATLSIHSVDSSLADGVGLYDKNSIPNISPNPDDANNNFGLGMKTGNSGWSMNGGSDFYSDPNGNVASFSGDSVYTIENSATTPSLSFYLYHSNNITEEKELGYYTITMDLAYWKDSLNQGRATVIIDISLGTSVYDDFGYNGAITPGTQYDLFTSTETNVTTDSSFSTYFELAEPNFKQNEQVKNFYDMSYRVINTEYAFPANTTITMIDRYDNANPEYYYYTVTEDDARNKKTEYRFSEFLAMGSTNEYYNEDIMKEKYYFDDLDYEYECFIFIVNFEGADFGTITDPNKMVTAKQHFRIFLRADVEAGRSEVLFGLLDDQIEATTFGIWDTESKIDIDASLNKTKIYLGNEAKLNIKTNYDVTIINSVRIYDTNYFDKKLGIKLTFYDKDTNQVITGSSLLGTYFELNGNKYYPRTDGTIRIKIAEKVSNATSSISINTENSTLASGKYYILVESFGSADGIYYGIKASASDNVDLEIINDIYGLKSTLPEEQVIIDKATGFTLEKDTGYISKDNNKLNIDLEYISGLTDPHITVSLYRRNYDDVYDMSYNTVDLKDYITEGLELLDSENLPLEYKLLNSDEINAKVTDPDVPVHFNIDYTLKQNLKTGTYKLVFTLYDKNIVTKTRPVDDGSGNIIQEEYQAIEYEHIGETYSYIIIK